MKNVKIVLWIVLVVLVALVFIQNKEFFTASQGLTLNLGFTDAFHGELPNAVWFLAALIIGLLVAYFFGLVERFRFKKIIKGLNAKMAAQQDMLTQLRNEVKAKIAITPEEVPGTSTQPPSLTATAPHVVETAPDD